MKTATIPVIHTVLHPTGEDGGHPSVGTAPDSSQHQHRRKPSRAGTSSRGQWNCSTPGTPGRPGVRFCALRVRSLRSLWDVGGSPVGAVPHPHSKDDIHGGVMVQLGRSLTRDIEISRTRPHSAVDIRRNTRIRRTPCGFHCAFKKCNRISFHSTKVVVLFFPEHSDA